MNGREVVFLQAQVLSLDMYRWSVLGIVEDQLNWFAISVQCEMSTIEIHVQSFICPYNRKTFPFVGVPQLHMGEGSTDICNNSPVFPFRSVLKENGLQSLGRCICSELSVLLFVKICHHCVTS